MTFHSRAVWLRRGSEAECSDRANGDTSAISDDDLAALLAYYYDNSLAVLAPDERDEAVAALVEGYRCGG